LVIVIKSGWASDQREEDFPGIVPLSFRSNIVLSQRKEINHKFIFMMYLEAHMIKSKYTTL
jgi:hypothetical protein